MLRIIPGKFNFITSLKKLLLKICFRVTENLFHNFRFTDLVCPFSDCWYIDFLTYRSNKILLVTVQNLNTILNLMDRKNKEFFFCNEQPWKLLIVKITRVNLNFQTKQCLGFNCGTIVMPLFSLQYLNCNRLMLTRYANLNRKQDCSYQGEALKVPTAY